MSSPVPTVPVLAVTTVALDSSVVDPSIDSNTSPFHPVSPGGVFFDQPALVSLDTPPEN